MAFVSDDLSVIAYANGFTLWHYATPDAADGVVRAGYFNDAASMLRVGDMILANTDIDGRFVSGMLHVASNANGEVGVDNLTRIAGSDGGGDNDDG